MADDWPSAAPADDPYLWLEQVDSPRAMDWVRAENAKTAAVLEKDARYPLLYKEALTIAQAQDRIPQPSSVGRADLQFLAGREPRARPVATHQL